MNRLHMSGDCTGDTDRPVRAQVSNGPNLLDFSWQLSPFPHLPLVLKRFPNLAATIESGHVRPSHWPLMCVRTSLARRIFAGHTSYLLLLLGHKFWLKFYRNMKDYLRGQGATNVQFSSKNHGAVKYPFD